MAPWIASSVDSQKKESSKPTALSLQQFMLKMMKYASEPNTQDAEELGGWVVWFVLYFYFFVFCLKCELILCLVM